jgi:L-cystine transport system substrate-binding protein
MLRISLKRSIGLLLALAVLAVSFGGCSSASSSSASAGDGVRTVKCATGQAMAPYCYIDENGKLTGYDVEVMRAVDEKLDKYSFDIQGMDFNTMVVALESNTIDMASNQFVKSDERKKKFLFPDQYFCLSPMVLVVKSDSEIKSLDDMSGKSIIDSPQSYEHTMLMSYNNSHPDKAMTLYTVNDGTTADNLKMIANGTVDATLSYPGVFDTANEELKLDLVKTDVVMCEDTYFMLGSDEQDLTKAVNDALVELKNDGTLSKLATQYLGEDVFSLYEDKIAITFDDGTSK